MLKKLIYILLACTLLMGTAACNSSLGEASATPAPESEESADPTPEPTPEEESGEESESEEEVEVPVIEGEEELSYSEELPMPTGDDEFVKAFNENPIDAQYIAENEEDLSTQSQMEVIGMATAHWETQMNYTYTKVLGLLDEEDTEQFEIEQQAWIGEVPIYLDQFQEDTQDLGTAGAMEYSYRTMILYRERAIELLSVEYEKSGEIELVSITGDAAG